AAPAAAAPGAAPQTPEPRFAIHEYRVLGNTVLTNRQIEGVLYPLLGDNKTLADVEAARAALEAAYHRLGYQTVYVDIPAQSTAEAIIRLRVTEGRIRARTIHGARYFSEGQILERMPATEPGKVLRIPDVQRELSAVNAETPDLSVTPIFKAGPDPGTTDVTLNVDDHLPLHGSLDFNNQYSADTDHLRATAALGYNDLFAALDSIQAQFTTSPQDAHQVDVLNVAYDFRPLGPGLRAGVSFTNSASNVATLGTLGVLGNGQVYGATLLVPITMQPTQVQSLTLALDYKHFRNTIGLPATNTAGVTTSGPTTVVQPIAYANLSLSYAAFWQRLGADGHARQALNFDISANAGPRGITNDTENFAANRYQGSGNYSYLRADLGFTTVLPANAQLQLRIEGQAAEDPLVVYEQDSLTGASAVRGYLEAEVLTDDGVRGTFQLQSPPLRLHNFLIGDGFVFIDGAHAHYLAPLPGQPVSADLGSFGAGLDLLPGRSLAGTLTWADPMISGPDTRAHDYRILFDVKGQF
ncbi:MAG TPA: POTRA domain-containing protein, partial [Steroidobacteraceae bacterium]|nr:POTRA domain-containing protein [Steroidobacteraceae bacterium]